MKKIIASLRCFSGLKLQVRYIQSFLLFLCITIAYFVRVNASLSVVAMTNKNTTNPDFDEFPWSLKEQSYILSSFYWTYIITQLPGGWIAQRYGAKWLLFISIAIPSLATLSIPFLVHWGSWQLMCAVRLIQGLSQGFIFPTLHSFLAKWAPYNERNRLVAFSQSGIEFGTILAFTASGYIAGSSLGWPGIYYISGSCGLIWCIIWLIFGANNPYECNYISKDEIKYIENSLKVSNDCSNKKNNKSKVPWAKIWSSGPFWTLIIVRCGFSWGFATFLTEIPTYMNSILEMNIQKNALFSGLPYLLMLIVAYLMLGFADLVVFKKWLSLSQMRKVVNSISSVIPGLSLIALGFVTKENWILAVSLVIIAVGTNGAHTIGSTCNHIDLSPNHAGILMGITNTIGNVITLIVPLVFAAIVTEKSNLFQWRIIFCIAAGAFIITNIIYLIFGKMEAQEWNKITEEEVEKVENDRKNDFQTIDLRSYRPPMTNIYI